MIRGRAFGQAALLAAALLAITTGAGAQTAPPLASGIEVAGFDRTVSPRESLFRAVNGRWLAATPIPPDKASVGINSELDDRVDLRVRTIVEALAAEQPAPGTPEQQVGSYYRSYLDEAAIDAAGSLPLKPWRDMIDAVDSPAALADVLGRLQGIAELPLAIWVAGDAKEPATNRAQLLQDGLGLPDRDYYLKPGARYEDARAAYRRYVATLFALDGVADADAAAGRVYAFERRLARAQWAREDSYDAIKTYNPVPAAALVRRAPGLDWSAFLSAAALPAGGMLTVAEPSYVRALARMARDEPLDTWRLYLRGRLLDAAADVLPQGFRDARFAFHGRTLSGLAAPKPRWQRATAAFGEALGESVGRLYVAQHFPPQNKARMRELVDNLLRAYAASIDTLDWMGPETKRRARDKLAKVTVKIGYPDRWLGSEGLVVKDGDALGNLLRAARYEHERRAARAGQPVDRGLWQMTPQTNNAYYEPSLNEIVFPAAILEPPFFDMAADDAANYGGIGATIGHEISHGFDDQGRLFDGDGRLTDWWTRTDRKAFEARTARLVAQYDAYEPIAGHRVNGRLTLGENIADLCGLEIALKAYHLALAGRPAPVIDGMSGDERFFYSYSQSWRTNTRDERMLQRLVADAHAPERYRVDGIVVNVDAFHATFATQPGDAMYKAPKARVRIW